MKTGYFKKFSTAFLLTPALLIGTLPASAQSYGRDDNRNQQSQQLQRRDQAYNQDRGQDRRDYDRDRDYRTSGYVTYAPAYPVGDYGYYRRDDGIGPGKGAAIGAVSGAVLGALFGGGKGAIIGGAAGAGIGAVAGHAAQDNRRY